MFSFRSITCSRRELYLLNIFWTTSRLLVIIDLRLFVWFSIDLSCLKIVLHRKRCQTTYFKHFQSDLDLNCVMASPKAKFRVLEMTPLPFCIHRSMYSPTEINNSSFHKCCLEMEGHYDISYCNVWSCLPFFQVFPNAWSNCIKIYPNNWATSTHLTFISVKFVCMRFVAMGNHSESIHEQI